MKWSWESGDNAGRYVQEESAVEDLNMFSTDTNGIRGRIVYSLCILHIPFTISPYKWSGLLLWDIICPISGPWINYYIYYQIENRK